MADRVNLPSKTRIGTTGLVFPISAAQDLSDLENRALRKAVQENLVSFPAQIPAFERQSQPDLQRKIVILYFARGWSMDDIAERYGLGRQRMGQILTAWRISAVREGYVSAIIPGHPFFKRVRFDEPLQRNSLAPQAAVTAPIRLMPSIASAPEVEQPPPAISSVRDLKRTNVAEQLQAIIGILDNQVRLRANHLNGSIESCEPLLASARKLCARLEAGSASAHRNDEWRITAAISAARRLFRRFDEHRAGTRSSADERRCQICGATRSEPESCTH